MRTIGWLLLIAGLWLSTAGQGLAQKGVLTIKDVTAAPGRVVVVEILMDESLKGVAAAQFFLDFSKSVPSEAPLLTALPANPNKPNSGEAKFFLGPIVPSGTFSLASATVPGRVNVGFAGIKSFDGPGLMVAIPLQIPAGVMVRTQYRLELILQVLNDIRIKRVEAEIRNGSLIVIPQHKLMFTEAETLRPGAETWIPLWYQSDEGAPIGKVVTSLFVTPRGSSRQPAAAITAVRPGSAIRKESFFALPISPSSVIMRITPPSPIPSGTILAWVCVRGPAGMEEEGGYDLTMADVRLSAPSGEAMPVDTVPAVLRVSILPGDLNADGSIDVLDVGFSLRFALGLLDPPSPAVFRRADVEPKKADGTYGDGLITVSDVLRILRRALGLDVGPWP
jgi:hypothetical protein